MTQKVITIEGSSPHYPQRLARIYGELALPQLRARGNIDLLARPSVGFCGSRNASEKGLSVAADLARMFVQHDVVVTSGYAKGVDTQAHRAALEAGGSTIISLPEGMNAFRVKRELADVWDDDRVLVISQYIDSAVWRADRAMERNKIIVGISAATIVIEAGSSGGTLDAGMTALRQGVPLFVAVYSDFIDSNQGNRILIESGARILGRNPRTDEPYIEKVLPFLVKERQ